MSYCAYITKIKKIRKHENADRLNIGYCFDNPVIVSLDVQEDTIGCYFPTDGQLSIEYSEKNNLVRKKDDAGNNIGGYLDPQKRNIRTLKLRGEVSDGLFMPLESLSHFGDISILKDGDTIELFNGVPICSKYIPNRKNKGCSGVANAKKKKTKEYPYFAEHIDTEQLVYNLGQFQEGDICTISLKMHGTSGRTSYTIKEFEKRQNFIEKLFKRPIKKEKVYDYVSGSRKVVLDFDSDNKGFYGDNSFRKEWHDLISPKLNKGESIYYEIVGMFNDTYIMSTCDNSKVDDKDFVKQYGNQTCFTYGCEYGKNDVYVYRMTMTNEDGEVVEYPTWFAKVRAEQMGLKFVPIFDQFVFTTKQDLMDRVLTYYDGVDPIGQTHIREGVVVRVENRSKMKAFKHKNNFFKMLEGIYKENATEPDMEEAQELQEE